MINNAQDGRELVALLSHSYISICVENYVLTFYVSRFKADQDFRNDFRM